MTLKMRVIYTLPRPRLLYFHVLSIRLDIHILPYPQLTPFFFFFPFYLSAGPTFFFTTVVQVKTGDDRPSHSS